MTDFSASVYNASGYDTDKGPIAKQYDEDDRERQHVLENIVRFAALTKPWIQPPLQQIKDSRLPENYQSVGSRGVNTLKGATVMALYPPDTPWFELVLASALASDPRIPADVKRAFFNALFTQELAITGLLESAQSEKRSNQRVQTFRMNKGRVIDQLYVTGDALERINPDFSITVFRRDQYVTARDSVGDVLYHIVREVVDPLESRYDAGGRSLIELALAAGAKVKLDELKAQPARKRLTPIYTECRWQPESRKWLISQEMFGVRIQEPSEDPVSPFISTVYELSPGDDYGRGLVELNRGDLHSLNSLSEKLLDWAALFSKVSPVIDHNSETREADLERPSGQAFRARVRAGAVDDIAFLGPQNAANFQTVFQYREALAQQLGKAFSIESEVQPTGERVTATQVSRIAREIDGATAGNYANIAEAQHLGTLRRVIWQAKKANLLAPLPEKAYEVRALTGLVALAREGKVARLLELPQLIQAMPEGTARRINFDVLIEAYFRYRGFDEPGLLKSEEQVRREMAEAMRAQAAMQATEKAIDTAGNVAEAKLTEQQ